MPDKDKPAKVALNLDALGRDDEPEPFAVIVEGKHYTLVDPQAIAWDDLMNITADPSRFLAGAVTADKRLPFTVAVGKLPGWKINKLSEAYQEHFGMPSDPEADGSPTS